jgi:hypothetical protein
MREPEEMNAHSWLTTRFEIKSDIRSLEEKTMFLMTENEKLKSLLKERVDRKVQQKEQQLEALTEDTKQQIEESVKEMLKEKRDDKAFEIFNKFLTEISKKS